MSKLLVDEIGGNAGADTTIASGKKIAGTASQFKMTDVVQGDVLYGSAADTLSRLAPGTSGQYLQTAGAAANPAWATVAAATLAPAFSVCTNATTSITASTDTKIVLDREIFDSNGAFDSSTNYRFTVPAGEGGKYFISASITFLLGSGGSTSHNFQLRLNINGTNTGQSLNIVTNQSNTTHMSLANAWMFDLVATDYVELFGYIEGTGTLQYNGDSSMQRTHMNGFKMVGI
jgi:hypothetical protein